jgi:hypothetical protein
MTAGRTAGELIAVKTDPLLRPKISSSKETGQNPAACGSCWFRAIESARECQRTTRDAYAEPDIGRERPYGSRGC